MGSAGKFAGPTGVAVDPSGNLYVGILYVTDHEENHTVRKLSLTGTNWLVSTLAGLAGQIGITDGMGASARFNNPTSIAVDSKGAVLDCSSTIGASRALSVSVADPDGDALTVIWTLDSQVVQISSVPSGQPNEA